MHNKLDITPNNDTRTNVFDIMSLFIDIEQNQRHYVILRIVVSKKVRNNLKLLLKMHY